MARIDGSEPQRLAFGEPRAVQAAFAEKMQLCWLSSPAGLLTGHRYDLTPVLIEGNDGPAALEQVTIFSNQTGGPAFVVQFHPFNDNTLISTRNLAFPPAVAAYMMRDVETWVFGQPDCAPPDAASVPPQSPASPQDLKSAPQTSSTPAARSGRGG